MPTITNNRARGDLVLPNGQLLPAGGMKSVEVDSEAWAEAKKAPAVKAWLDLKFISEGGARQRSLSNQELGLSDSGHPIGTYAGEGIGGDEPDDMKDPNLPPDREKAEAFEKQAAEEAAQLAKQEADRAARNVQATEGRIQALGKDEAARAPKGK